MIWYYYIDTSVLLENIPLVKFIKTTSGTRVVYFPPSQTWVYRWRNVGNFPLLFHRCLFVYIIKRTFTRRLEDVNFIFEWILFSSVFATFTLLVFRTKQGVWQKGIQPRKGFHFPSTRTTNSVRLILGSQYSLCENHMTSPSALRAETSSRYQSDPPENQIWHTDEAGASLTCYQSTLISGTSFFSQWYFPSSGRSTNEISWEIVASSPFLCPSRLRRSLARSRETRFTRPNRRASSQASFCVSLQLEYAYSVQK